MEWKYTGYEITFTTQKLWNNNSKKKRKKKKTTGYIIK